MQIDLVAVDEMEDAVESFVERRKSRGESFNAVNLEEIDETLGTMDVKKVPVEDDGRTAEDDLAIAEAIQQIESELKGKQKKARSNSLVDSMTEMDLDEVDESLRGIEPSQRTPRERVAERASEDDVAIAEAIAQVEKELKTQQGSKYSAIIRLLVLFAVGFLISKAFTKFMGGVAAQK